MEHIAVHDGAVPVVKAYAPYHHVADGQGWDPMSSTVLSAYMVATVAFLGAILVWKDWAHRATEFQVLATQAILFGVFTGVAFGFGGAAHHTLQNYWEAGHGMSLRFFHTNFEWLLLWTVATFFYPLASAGLAGVAIAIADKGSWNRWCLVIAFIVGLVEQCVSCKKVEYTGYLALGWAVIMSVVAIGVIASASSVVGSSYVGVAAAFHVTGLCMLIFMPKDCWDTDPVRDADGDDVTRHCKVPFDFHKLAIFNILTTVAVVFVYVAAAVRLRKDRESEVRQPRSPDRSSSSPSRRTCGCSA